MHRLGFEVARCAAPQHACKALRAHALNIAISKRVVEQTCASIRSPECRSHLALKMTPECRAILSSTIKVFQARGAWQRAGLCGQSALVELSCMVSYPGAHAQSPHTDVPPDSPRGAATLWVALQDVHHPGTESSGQETMGPLHVYGSNLEQRQAALRWRTEQRQAFRHGGSGSGGSHGPTSPPARGGDSWESLGDVTDAAAGCGLDVLASRFFGGGATPVALAMCCGDAALVDLRTFHFGGANDSQVPRAMLSATFEAPGPVADGGARDEKPTVTTTVVGRNELGGRTFDRAETLLKEGNPVSGGAGVFDTRITRHVAGLRDLEQLRTEGVLDADEFEEFVQDLKREQGCVEEEEEEPMDLDEMLREGALTQAEFDLILKEARLLSSENGGFTNLILPDVAAGDWRLNSFLNDDGHL